MAGRELCEALYRDDRRALHAAIDAFLGALGPAEPVKARMRALADWLGAQECVAAVAISPDLNDTEPATQDVAVTLRDGTKRAFGVVLSPDRLHVDAP